MGGRKSGDGKKKEGILEEERVKIGGGNSE